MSITSKKFDPASLTPRERKSYQNGLAEVARKLAGRRKATYQEQTARTMAQGLAAVRHKLATAAKARTMAAPTPAKPPAPATKSPAPAGRKTYSTPGPKTRHRYTVPGGIFGP